MERDSVLICDDVSAFTLAGPACCATAATAAASAAAATAAAAAAAAAGLPVSNEAADEHGHQQDQPGN